LPIYDCRFVIARFLFRTLNAAHKRNPEKRDVPPFFGGIDLRFAIEKTPTSSFEIGLSALDIHIADSALRTQNHSFANGPEVLKSFNSFQQSALHDFLLTVPNVRYGLCREKTTSYAHTNWNSQAAALAFPSRFI
jgi:hypothetical protein